jgi:short-subunit dehydrogenase
MCRKVKTPNGIKTALVTGANRGIGKAFVNEFAHMGLDCVLVGRNESALSEVAQSLEKQYGVNTWVFIQDLAVPNAAQNVYNFCKEQGIQVDVLVNNAGMLIFSQFETLPKVEVESILNLHVHCTTMLAYLFGKEMVKREKGFIINMSSASAWMTFPGTHLYNSTKRYIRDFSRSIFYEFKRSNVGVTVVCPSGVDTNFFPLSQRLRKLGVGLGLLIKPERLVKIAIRDSFTFKKQVIPTSFDSFFISFVREVSDPTIFWLMNRLSLFELKKQKDIPPEI